MRLCTVIESVEAGNSLKNATCPHLSSKFGRNAPYLALNQTCTRLCNQAKINKILAKFDQIEYNYISPNFFMYWISTKFGSNDHDLALFSQFILDKVTWQKITLFWPNLYFHIFHLISTKFSENDHHHSCSLPD